MLAITTGTTVPLPATNLLNPVLCRNALLQTTNTNVAREIWINPAITDAPAKRGVKFAIMKKQNAMAPEIAIHRELPKSPPF